MERRMMAAAVLCLALTAEMCHGWGTMDGEQVWDKTKETMQQAVEQAKEAAELVKDKTGQALKGGGQDHGSGAFSDWKNKDEASEKGQEVMGRDHETIQRVKEAGESKAQEAKDVYEHAKEKLSQAAGDFGSRMRSDEAGGDKAASEAKDMYGDAKEKISQAAGDVGSRLRDDKDTGGEL